MQLHVNLVVQFLFVTGVSCYIDERDEAEFFGLVMGGDFQVDGTIGTKALHVIDDQKKTNSQARAQPNLLHVLKCVKKGAHACSIKCSQGKFLRRDGCCTCVCRKNFAKFGASACHKASWSHWGNWTNCIKTEWGGLQTRERVCKSLGEETPGSCDGRGSESKTCVPVTGKFRIRKNVRDLTHEELHDLIQAMTKFKMDFSKNGYRNIISWHGWPGRCPWYDNITGHDDSHCSWHHHPLFLPWHRMITLQLELGLSRYLENKTLGIPYWDWTEHNLDIPYLVRHSEIYDPILEKYVHNPFRRNFIKYLDGGHKLYSQRNIWIPGVLMDKYLQKGTVRGLLCHNYYQFDEQISGNPHDQIHDCFCIGNKVLYNKYRACNYGMPTVTYAAWDPVFMLHHSNIDRIFAMRRHIEENFGVADWTSSRVAGEYTKRAGKEKDIAFSFTWPMSPFCNKTMNPQPVTNADGVWTLHKSYFNEQLFGYKYADFNLGNYTWENLLSDYRTNNARKGKYWNDEFFHTKLGPLTKRNSYELPTTDGCTMKYFNPV